MLIFQKFQKGLWHNQSEFFSKNSSELQNIKEFLTVGQNNFVNKISFLVISRISFFFFIIVGLKIGV